MNDYLENYLGCAFSQICFAIFPELFGDPWKLCK